MTEFMEAPPILWEGMYGHHLSPDSHKVTMANEAGFCYLLNALMQLSGVVLATRGELSSLSCPPHLYLNFIL